MQSYIDQFKLNKVLPPQVVAHMTLSTFKKGQYIFTQGDFPEYMHFLVEGRLKIFAASDEGRKLIIAFTQPFGVFGDIEFVQQQPYLNTGEAVTDGKLLKIPMKIMEEYGRTHFPFIQFLLDHITRKFYENAHAQSFNMLHSVDVRFASYLLSSTTEFENYVSLQHIRDVADSIGTSYRHLNRIIAQLGEEGLIERSQRTIRILNRPQLYKLAKQNIYEER
ncbi:MAG: Crp/Fnr family transcriptional regulator [Kurthia sp.]|nr:Crp/Fnr family transcriptional regulator [Candidatus Kurthia equi]